MGVLILYSSITAEEESTIKSQQLPERQSDLKQTDMTSMDIWNLLFFSDVLVKI